MLGISLQAEEPLAFQEGLCSISFQRWGTQYQKQVQYSRFSLLYYPRILYFVLYHLFTFLTTKISAPERINLKIQYWIIIKVSFILSETVIQHNIHICDW